METVAGIFLLVAVVEIAYHTFWGEEAWVKWNEVSIPILALLFLSVCGITGFLLLALGVQGAPLALAYGIGICASLFSPASAVCFFVVNLLIRPWEVFLTNEILALIPRFLALLAILSWVIHRLRRRRLFFVFNRWFFLLTLLFAWMIFTSMLSTGADENVGDLFKIIFPTYVVCFLMLNSIENQIEIDLLMRSVCWAITGVIAIAIVYTFTTRTATSGILRLNGPGQSGNANDLAALIVLILPFLWTSFRRRLQGSARYWMEAVCLAILVYGITVSKSRAGVAALIVSFAVYLLLISESAKRLLLRFVLVAPPLLIILNFAFQRDSSDLAGSNESRLNYMIAGIKTLQINPLIGVGPRNYAVYASRFFTSYLEEGQHTAHSTWILLLSETGPIGLAILLILFFSVGKRAWLMAKSRPEFFMAFVGYGIAMTFLSHTYLFYPYLLIFMTASAWRVSAQVKGS